MTGLSVTELHTQDGWDWPNGCAHEEWPAQSHQPAAPYFREQLAQDEGGGLVLVCDPPMSERLVDSGMTFHGIPLRFDKRFGE